MGWFQSNQNYRKKKNDAQIRRIESALFVKILKFDLNLGANPQLTIESRFTRENTNDMGEGLLPQTSQIIIMEFKKYMYLVATEILRRRREGQLDLTKNFKSNKIIKFKLIWKNPLNMILYEYFFRAQFFLQIYY